MSSETCTVKINQRSDQWDAPFTTQYTVTGHDMSEFKKDWDACKDARKESGDMWDDESQLIADMEAKGYQFDSNNFDEIDVEC